MAGLYCCKTNCAKRTNMMSQMELRRSNFGKFLTNKTDVTNDKKKKNLTSPRFVFFVTNQAERKPMRNSIKKKEEKKLVSLESRDPFFFFFLKKT